MFDLSTSHLIQLLIAIGGGVLLFILSHMGLQRFLFKLLIVIIPFQFLNSRYGSLNMALTYVLGVSMLINRSWIKKITNENWPLIVPFVFILCSFIISWILAPRMFFRKNMFYFIMLGSNIVMFYMTYYMISDEKDVKFIINALLICNILVIVYTTIQMMLGFSSYSLFGIQEFTFQAARGSATSELVEKRIVGPFSATGITAEYFVLQSLLIAFCALMGIIRPYFSILLLMANMALLFGTANRGGFISLVFSYLLFLSVFRKKIGFKIMVFGSILMFLITTVAFTFMFRYTNFDLLFTRLFATKVTEGKIDTRQGWPYVIDKSMEKPIIGHGPRLVPWSEAVRERTRLPKSEIGFYPHNLYLYIFYTLGFLGLLSYGCLALNCFNRLLSGIIRTKYSYNFVGGMFRLGLICFIIFLFDQIKIEFLRSPLLDYQHYISILFGMFCGLNNISHSASVIAKS